MAFETVVCSGKVVTRDVMSSRSSKCYTCAAKDDGATTFDARAGHDARSDGHRHASITPGGRIWCCIHDPVPQVGCSRAFCAGSLVHVSKDVGVRTSVALHAALFMCAAHYGAQIALNGVLGYMLAVHVPLHYARCWKNDHRNGVKMALAATIPSTIAIDINRNVRIAWQCGVWHRPGMQRLALGHMLCNDMTPERVKSLIRMAKGVFYELSDAFENV